MTHAQRMKAIKDAVYWLGDADCRHYVSNAPTVFLLAAMLTLIAVVPVRAITPPPFFDQLLLVSRPIEAKPTFFLLPHSLVDRASLETKNCQPLFYVTNIPIYHSIKLEIIGNGFRWKNDGSALHFVNSLASCNSDKNQKSFKKRLNIASWLWAITSITFLFTSYWFSFQFVVCWKSRRDFRAAVNFVFAAISCWSAIGIIAWLNWP